MSSDITLVSGLVGMVAMGECNIHVSSFYSSDHGPEVSIINQVNPRGQSGWAAAVNDTNQFYTIGTNVPRNFMAVGTQGKPNADQWVKSYKVRYSLDNVNWVWYNNGEVLTGNVGRNDIKINTFKTPILARSMSIIPCTWQGHISMRCDFYAMPLERGSFTQTGQVVSKQSGDLYNGVGTEVIKVKFPKEFPEIPKVYLALDTIDNTENGCRISCQPRSITKQDFECVFQVFGETKCFQLKCDYVANVSY